jgi:hypothetical protein
MMRGEMNRKDFLRIVFLGLATGAGGSLLASCSKKEETEQTAESSGDAPKPATKSAAADPCTDVSGLSEMDLTMRNETLKYVAVSPEPDKKCDNCKFWQPSEEAGAACGGCQLIKGPIDPKGYCTSWFIIET